MPVVLAGDTNLTAQVVPNVLVQVVTPRVQVLTGVPSNVVGLVGTAVWGPVGVPAIVGNFQEQIRWFGPPQNRPRDLGTLMATAHQQGATQFRNVRVTDGTDTAAQVVVPTDAITYTSRYSGSLGSKIKVQHSAGSKPSTWRVRVMFPDAGFLDEVFDNIEGTGNALWVNVAAAINGGQYGIRSASEIVIATAGAGTTAASAATYTLAGGTDGVSGVTDATLVGSDSSPRQGMYALRGSGASIVALAECVDTATWPAQVAFGRSEGAYMMLVGPKGETVSSAATAKATAGIDDQAAKVILGDWCYWFDATNGLPERLVSPQGFFAGRLANLSPERSGLNKRLFSIVATQRVKLNRPYSDAELQALGQAGIDVIANPVPGGFYYGPRFGRNSSSNPSIRGDHHTRLTNYIAATLDKGMGIYVGEPNSPETRQRAKVSVDSLLQAMRDLGMIEDFKSVCDESNNPPDRRGVGYLQLDLQVRYFGIVETLLANLEGGSTVQITRQSIVTVGAAAAAA